MLSYIKNLGPEQAEQRHEQSERWTRVNVNVEFSLQVWTLPFNARRSIKKSTKKDSNRSLIIKFGPGDSAEEKGD